MKTAESKTTTPHCTSAQPYFSTQGDQHSEAEADFFLPALELVHVGQQNGSFNGGEGIISRQHADDDLDAGASSGSGPWEWLEQQLQCVIYTRGGCPNVPGVSGVADDAAIRRYDQDCRTHTRYAGPVLRLSDLNCDQPALAIAQSLAASYPGWLDILPDCPCQLRPNGRLSEDWSEDANPNLQSYHPGARKSFRSVANFQSIPGTEHRQQCCYDSAGSLITSGAAAGTPDVWASFGNHISTDVDTFNSMGWQTYTQYWIPNNGNNCNQNVV